MSLCGGCLASDRTLKPVTTSLLYLLNFLNTRNKGRPSKNSNSILFCWECSSFLHRVREFHYRVNIAQAQLKKLRNKTEIKPLSNLHITTINKDYDLIITEEEKLCTELEIKEEFESSENFDDDNLVTFENYYKSEHSDIEKIENDIKDYTGDINNQNIFGSSEDISGNSENIPGSSRDYNTRCIDKTFKIVTKIKDTSILAPGIKVKNEIKLENEDTLDNFDIKNESENGVIQKKSRKGRTQKKKYNILHCTELQSDELTKYMEVSNTDLNTTRQWFHQVRQTVGFTSSKYKCLYCLKIFVAEKGYLSHKKKEHLNGNENFVCDVCDRGFPSKRNLLLHIQAHKYKYTCKLCKEDFYMKTRILSHLQRHTTSVQCRECGVIFERLREFHAHYRSLHTIYTCDYCGKTTRIKSSLEKHMLVHTLKYCKICDINFKGSRIYLKHYRMQHLKTESDSTYCVECDMRFPNMDRYKYHLRTAVRHIDKSKNKKYPCPVCKKEYAKKLTMKYHYQHYHLKKTKFYCEKCNRYMLNPFQLREHNARVHDKIPLPKNKICDICGRGFSTNKILINHRRTHTGERPFQCEYCSAAFAQKCAMNTHMKTQHKRHTLKYCKICDKNFKSSKFYLRHYKMQHLKTEDSAYCVECDKTFPNIDRYKYHLWSTVRHNDKSKAKKHPCPVCKKEYATRLNMNYHYQFYHLKKSQYYCEKCNKYMLSPSRLKEHNKRVHDKIPLPKNKCCDICGRGFSTNKILNNHRRTHTGERPFQCEYCSAAFAQRSAMKTHMKTQHKLLDKD